MKKLAVALLLAVMLTGCEENKTVYHITVAGENGGIVAEYHEATYVRHDNGIYNIYKPDGSVVYLDGGVVIAEVEK